MANKFIIRIAILVCFCALTACKKYEENPLINLRSKNYRLTGNEGYTPAGFWVDGIDITHSVDPIGYINFTEERGGRKVLYTAFLDGTWDFRENKKYLHINLTTQSTYPYGVLLTGGALEWRITKLTDRELHINTDFMGKHYVLHLSKKKL